ncbi:MAG: hypothetical protein HRU19_26320 [Pseudobacteriovorax sp.]|nr:hypothetical protein [Pseudobacteriovorax sp.]
MPPERQHTPNWPHAPQSAKGHISDILGLCIDFKQEVSAPQPNGAHLETLHKELIKLSASLVENRDVSQQNQLEFRQSVVRALDFMLYMHEYIIAPEIFIDTFGSACLVHHKQDLKKQDAGAIRSLIQKNIGLPKEEIERLTAKNTFFLQDAAAKKNIIKALCDIFEIQSSLPKESLETNIQRFFQEIFEPLPFPRQSIQIIISGNMIFFTLPFAEKSKKAIFPEYESMASADRILIDEFIKKINSFRQDQFAHFPVFGFLKGEHLSDSLIETICKKTDYRKDFVRSMLNTIFTILPQDQVDKYLLHDVWGHSWQAGMLDFEKLYQDIATYALDFNDLITESGSHLKNIFSQGYNQELWLQFVTDTIMERLPIALAPVIAEMLADIVECKFLKTNPELAHRLPSSSVFKSKPVKLDFMFEDLEFYFRQARKTFDLWLKYDSRKDKTKDRLSQILPDHDEDTIHDILKHMEQDLKVHLERHFSYHLSPKSTGSKLSIYDQLTLNFLSQIGAFIRTFQELDGLNFDQSPMDRFVDLLAISTGLFYEKNHQENIWKIDEYVGSFFVPLVEQLHQDHLDQPPKS